MNYRLEKMGKSVSKVNIGWLRNTPEATLTSLMTEIQHQTLERIQISMSETANAKICPMPTWLCHISKLHKS